VTFQRSQQRPGLQVPHRESCAAEIAKLVPCEFEPEISSCRVWFIPKEMGAMMPDVDVARWKLLPRLIPACIWLRYSASKLRAQLSLEIGPAADDVTLRLLHEEYVLANPNGYGYTKFVELYNAWAERLKVVMR
jgi:hypothetical protein